MVGESNMAALSIIPESMARDLPGLGSSPDLPFRWQAEHSESATLWVHQYQLKTAPPHAPAGAFRYKDRDVVWVVVSFASLVCGARITHFPCSEPRKLH